MANAIEKMAADFNLDANTIKSLMDYIIDRVGDKITAENVNDIINAFAPKWLQAQERMATEALTNFPEFCATIKASI